MQIHVYKCPKPPSVHACWVCSQLQLSYIHWVSLQCGQILLHQDVLINTIQVVVQHKCSILAGITFLMLSVKPQHDAITLNLRIDLQQLDQPQNASYEAIRTSQQLLGERRC